MLDRIERELRASSEFLGEIADNVMVVVKGVVSFVAARLDSPKPYQREDGKGASAVEADLQEDLFDWLRSGALLRGRAVWEPQRVGGGRPDISVVFVNQVVVNELKREQKDSSHEAMEETYSGQAGSYDATTYPFGLVTVLDVSAEPPSTPRLDGCVWVHRREDESGTRWLVFVRVPGRLSAPSVQTKRAQRS